jgi:hypothetical protein
MNTHVAVNNWSVCKNSHGFPHKACHVRQTKPSKRARASKIKRIKETAEEVEVEL